MAEEQQEQRQTAGDLHDEVDALKADLRQLQTDLRQVTNSLWDVGQQSYRQTSEQMHDRVESSLKQAEDYVQRQPLKTVAICFVSGFVLGKLFSRR
jgi:ElaB/YqjD/DUF883 family membrane-anchored ribosome-binding protein